VSGTLGRSEFDFLRALVRERSAIVLEPGKEYLVESRVVPLLRDRQLGSVAALVGALRQDPHGDLAREVVEAMTTNETSFFRDLHPFEALRTVLLPTLLIQRATDRKLRIWSNACSSGQEAYSLAMLLYEHVPAVRDWNVSILATDLSRRMVHRTGQGRYGQLEVNRGLPAQMLLKYFDRRGTEWEVKPQLRRWVQARELNLIGPWPPLPRFDLIMLRNVLIYFDREARRTILRRARQALRPDGYLFLGSAETTTMADEGWERMPCGASVAYRLLPSPRTLTGVAL
jgi:chemotaxis protein methyltransferase CheR